MSAGKKEAERDKPRVTVEDLKRKAEEARDIARDQARETLRSDASKYVAVLSVVFLAGVSIAYLLGAKSRR